MSFLKRPVAAVSNLVADPFETWTKVQEVYADWRKRSRPLQRYAADEAWERGFHERLNLRWPCTLTAEFRELWPKVMRELQAKGIRPGPASFKAYNDGDAGLGRAAWCLVRHLKPRNVVETGVAHGVTSRIILEALKSNGCGHLWSIDLPPREKVWQEQVGIAVGDGHGDRWSYIRGSSRRRLPKLLSELGEIDIFIHDSLHSERNVVFELAHAWAALRPGGAIVADDVDVNWGWHSFAPVCSGHLSIVCEAEPVQPDSRRFNQKGLFGIILKNSASSSSLSAAVS
jgi:hypothetical protein